nr:hypothetical protein [Desulfotignum phosphitoxidans]
MDQADHGHGSAQKRDAFLGGDQDMVTELDQGAGGTVCDQNLAKTLAPGNFAQANQFVGVPGGGNDHHHGFPRRENQLVHGSSVTAVEDADTGPEL